MSPNLIMALSVIIGLAMLVLSVLIGYNLYQGGKEINNDKISKAGLYWLIIIAVSLIISIISYVGMNNAVNNVKEESSESTSSSVWKAEEAILEYDN
jgi:high-affinity Fe2+/Pb2+ permease